MAAVAGELLTLPDGSSGADGAFEKAGELLTLPDISQGARIAARKSGELILGPPGGPILNFVMRGYNPTPSEYIFWLASSPDAAPPVGVIDVVIFRIKY